MRIAVITGLVLLSYGALAQGNLVPNPGFEGYNTCPDNNSCMNYSPGYNTFTWVQAWVSPTQASPDYYNGCSTFAAGVPKNSQGYQPARSGNAYTGIYAFQTYTINPPPNYDYREYIACKLLDSLRNGLRYEAVFYVSPIYRRTIETNTDQLGIHFSDTAVYSAKLSFPMSLTIPYSIKNTPGNMLFDTAKWTKVSGIYTAHGGERYMVIGCFNDTFKAKGGAYFYIDDVSVAQVCDTIDNGIKNINLCSLPYTDTLVVGEADNYLWNTGNTTNTIIINGAGNYSCISKKGCRVIMNGYNVRAFTPDTFTALHDTVVCGSGTATANISSIDSGEIYLWNTSDTIRTISISKPGIYWCKSYRNCSTYIDSFSVKIYEEYASSATDTVVCIHDNPLLASPRTAGEYMWNTGATTAGISVTDTGIYWCEARSVCRLFRDTFHVVQKPFDKKPVLGADRVVCKTEADRLDIGTEINPATKQYVWNTGANGCCITITTPGAYILNVSDGCTTLADTVNVSFMDDCRNCITVPTAFSPNNDNLNDRFRVVTLCPFQFFEISIYNRWGQKVYTSNNPQEGWAGTFIATDAEAGTYYYMVRYKTPGSNHTYFSKGDVVLIR